MKDIVLTCACGFYTCWEASLLTMKDPNQTRVALPIYHVADGGKKAKIHLGLSGKQ